jgi:hypothetical protein
VIYDFDDGDVFLGSCRFLLRDLRSPVNSLGFWAAVAVVAEDLCRLDDTLATGAVCLTEGFFCLWVSP